MTRSTWLLPGVWVGFIGSVLVGVGACSNAFSFNPDGWGVGVIAALGSVLDRTTGNWLVALGCVALCAAWLMLVPREGVRAPVWVWLVWSVPLLVVPPVMSGDPFLYADLGWIMVNGGHPYVNVLGSYGGPYAPFVDAFWAGNGVAYPPLALEVNRLMVLLGGLHPYWGVVAQRVPALIGMGLLAAFLPRLADRIGADRHWAVWLGVLNPIAIVHLVGGAHNDTLMVGVVVFALWLSLQNVRYVSASLVLAPIVIGLAMALKQQAGLAVVAAAGLPVAAQLVNLPHPQRIVVLGWRTALAAVVALLTFVGVSFATGLGFGWVNWMSQMGRARTLTPWAVLGDVFLWSGRDLAGPVNTLLMVLAVAGIAALLLAHPEQPMLATAWGSLLVLCIGQALHPWYVGLGLALVGLLTVGRTGTRALVFGTIGYLLAYAATNLFGAPNLASAATGLVCGLVAYALWTSLGPRPTRLG